MRDFVAPMMEVPQMIVDSGGDTLDLCYQCGTCSGTCPWNLVRDFRVRNIITRAQLGLEGYEGDDLWLCATCNACVDRCPRGVEIVDLVRTVRGLVTQSGSSPKTLRSVMGSIQSNGNPWAGDAGARMAWAKELAPPEFAKGTEYAYFTCCTQAYDPRNVKVAKAAVKVLGAAGVSYGFLGGGESCCGDAVRKAGGEDAFTKLVASNVKLLDEKGAKKVIVPSPHCLNSFTKEYPALGGKYEAVHMAVLMNELVKAKKLSPAKPVKAKAIWHDPCYLGRHNGVYDAPRELLRAIPGVELMEFDRIRDDAVCCGGGGGRLWMETTVDERFAVLKMKEAMAKGADTIVTACPYCISMFEDAKTALNAEGVRVAEIAEIVADAV